MKRENVIDKIKKCLALSASSNPNEAAIALKQAKKLMIDHQITNDQITTSNISQLKKKRHTQKPNEYEVNLASIVSQFFSCQLLLEKVWDSNSNWIFVGMKPNNEIAAYTFSVLFKKLKQARSQYITTIHPNTKKSNKIALANTFCLGWVLALCPEISKLVPSKEMDIINSYISEVNPDMKVYESKEKTRLMSNNQLHAYLKGKHAAKDVRLSHAVNQNDIQLAIE